jgi:hypothetical protein
MLGSVKLPTSGRQSPSTEPPLRVTALRHPIGMMRGGSGALSLYRVEPDTCSDHDRQS